MVCEKVVRAIEKESSRLKGKGNQVGDREQYSIG